MIADGESTIAGPSDADLVRNMDEIIKAWPRTQDVVTNGSSLWGANGISPRGVHQGDLGDCWMLAAASSLAEHGSRIEKLFANVEAGSVDFNEDGFYVFEFFLLGEPKYITIDDRLPCNDVGEGDWFGETGTQYDPFMAGPSDNGGMWFPLLEKAYAKFTKTYADLNGGWEVEALRAMTGMPAKRFDTW